MPITKIGNDILLQEHQQRVLDRLREKDLPGLIAYHSVGSGKTLTALKALEEAKAATGKKGLVITPASLQNNIWKEIDKHSIPLTADDLDVFSYEKAAKNVNDLLQNQYGLAVFDEAHRLRNKDSDRVRKLKRLAGKADKRLLLTGTAAYNKPSDISQLVHFINRRSPLPIDPIEFETEFVNQTTGDLKHKKKLKDELGKYIDVYERPKNDVDFPSVTEKLYEIPMSEKQTKLYKFIERQMPPEVRMAIRHNIAIDPEEAMKVNAFSSGVRAASDSTMGKIKDASPHDSPKLEAAVASMLESYKNPRFRGLAYSNFIDSGLVPYEALLKEKGVTPYKITGGVTQKEKKRIVNEFNALDDTSKILLLSSSGGEGLDLKGVRKLQILEPHFNSSKIDQVKGRGARYKSHAHLPENERNLLIERYHSVFPPKKLNILEQWRTPSTIDSYLYDYSKRKQHTIDELRKLVSETNSSKRKRKNDK